MKNIKRFTLIFIIESLVSIFMIENTVIAIPNNEMNHSIRIAVLFYSYDNIVINLFKEEFIEMQKKNQGKVEFTFYDGKNDQQIQNKTIDTILKTNNADALLVNLVDSSSAKELISKIKEYNIPLIFLNIEPENIRDIQSYNKAYLVGADEKLVGAMEGEIIVEFWNKNKNQIDKNKDGKLQYIMLSGLSTQKTANERSKYSILAIEQSGVKTQELISVEAGSSGDLAMIKLQSLLLNYLNKVEAIISNNDEMAIGAIKVLKKYGYNKDDKSKYISIVGVGGIPEAKQLIRKGEMLGTIEKSAKEISDVSYGIAMNLICRKAPLEGINYKFDQSGVAVRTQIYKYTGERYLMEEKGGE